MTGHLWEDVAQLLRWWLMGAISWDDLGRWASWWLRHPGFDYATFWNL